MSKSRTTPKKKSQKTPQGKPWHVAELDAFDASQIDVLLPQLAARHAPITDAHRAAYASLISDAQADLLGARTQAVDIRAQAMRWAPILDAGVRTHADVLQGYTSARFVHLLERISALHQAIRADQEKRSKVGEVKAAADAARTAATTARDACSRALRSFAGQRTAEREALAAALGTSKTDETLLVSVTALAKLGQEWLELADESSKILAATAHLTPALVAATVDAARKLKEAMSGATIEGGARAKDSATVNRHEGRLTFELLEARRIWNDASVRTGLVPKLTPTASVRHIFVRKTGPGGVEIDATDTGAEGTGAGAEGDAGAPPKK